MTQSAGMILGDVLPGRVMDVNEFPKSRALPRKIRKDDCHNGLLVRSLGIMMWTRESSREDSRRCSKGPAENDQQMLDHPS